MGHFGDLGYDHNRELRGMGHNREFGGIGHWIA